VKVRVAIPAANPPDNATDLTSTTPVARLLCGPRENPMTQCEGLDVPTWNARQLVLATGFGASGNNGSYAGGWGCRRREVGVDHG
jgi:hypothetical protein